MILGGIIGQFGFENEEIATFSMCDASLAFLPYPLDTLVACVACARCLEQANACAGTTLAARCGPQIHLHRSPAPTHIVPPTTGISCIATRNAAPGGLW